jgi:hypothetical protein
MRNGLTRPVTRPLTSPLARGVGEGGGGFSAESLALFARMTVAPSGAQKAKINSLIGSLHAAGVWQKLDALYILASHDEQSAKLNWVQSAYNLTASGTMSFTAGVGYKGDGVSGKLATGFAPSTAGGKFARDSASFSAYSAETLADSGQVIGNDASVILPTGGVVATVRVNNTGTAATGANTASTGHFIANRSGANAETLRRNKVQLASGTAASVALTAREFWLLGRNTVAGAYAPLTLGAAHIGSALTVAEQDSFTDALDAFFLT